MATQTNRRDFIRLTALAGSSLLLPPLLIGCNSCSADDRPLMAKTDDPFEVWRQMVELLEKSPDHFIGQRKALIASKDPKAMTEFVRDHFQLIPANSADFMKGIGYRSLYGTENALRCGLATAREKAEILKNMLIEAGYEAKVILEQVEMSEEDLKKILFRDSRPQFAPPISKKQIKQWYKVLGAEESNGTFNEIENPEKIGAEFTKKLGNGLKDKSFEEDKYKFTLSEKEVPSVTFQIDGQEHYAHLLDPATPFGELHVTNTDKEIRDAPAIDTIEDPIKITLSCRTAISPRDSEYELLTGTWPIKDLTGSMVFLKFMNNLGFKQQVTHTVGQIDSFTPVFSFQKIGTTKEFMEENSFVGDPFDSNARKLIESDSDSEKNKTEITLTKGDLQPTVIDSLIADNMEISDSLVHPITGSVSSRDTLPNSRRDTLQMAKTAPLTEQIKDTLLQIPADTLQKPAPNSVSMVLGTTQDVSNLEVKALPKVFPDVLLEVSPTNTAGEIVGGLTADDFEWTDNGKPIQGKMTQNQIGPKLLLLYDTSGSMPKEYRRKDLISEFHQKLSHSVFELYPNAKITLKETGSYLYTAMLKAKQSDFDIVLYCTDSDNKDSFNPAYSEIYEAGQPIIMLEVITYGFFQDIKNNIKNLISIPASDQDKTIEAISASIAQLNFPPYVFTYSTTDEEKLHHVKVALKKKKNITGETTFKFPKPNDEFIGNRIVGLYLHIKGKHIDEKRTLAGWDHRFYEFKASRSLTHEVHEMLLGGAVLSFEREAPTLSLRLTEYLKAMLSQENWFKAQQKGDPDKTIQHLEDGTLNYPSLLLSMTQPLPNSFSKKSITYPEGHRISILKIKPGLYEDHSKISFDYLPTAKYVTLSRSGDHQKMFITNLEKTMQLAVLESQMFSDSTLHQLKDKPLIEIESAKKEEGFPERLEASENQVIKNRVFREKNILVFFDKSFVSSAYFKINDNTGEVFALLPDGTGGGTNAIQVQLEEIQKVVDAYHQLNSATKLGLMGVGPMGFPLGIVATYGMTLVKLYAAAAETLVVMDAEDLDDQVRRALAGLACNLYKSIAYLSIGPVGKGMSGLENLIGLMGGKFSFVPCPS